MRWRRITGALSFTHAKPGIIRALIAERIDPVLFALSYDYVGDLSETVALLWPDWTRRFGSCVLSPACGGETERGLFARHNAPSPTLPRKRQRGRAEFDRRFRCNSRQLNRSIPHPLRRHHHARHSRQSASAGAACALARCARRDRALGAAQTRHRRAAHRCIGAACENRGGGARRQGRQRDRDRLAGAGAALSRIFSPGSKGAARSRSRAHAGPVPPRHALARDRGGRTRGAQSGRLLRRMEMGRHPRAGRRRNATRNGHHVARLYSRTGEDISKSFPELCDTLRFDGAIDGELLVVREGRVQIVQRSAAAAQPQDADAPN